MEFCPMCRELRNTNISLSEKKIKNGLIIIENYSCEECGVFIRAEITEKQNKKHRQ